MTQKYDLTTAEGKAALLKAAAEAQVAWNDAHLNTKSGSQSSPSPSAEPNLIAKKSQMTMLVPQELLDDTVTNLTDWLANPSMRSRPAPQPLTRRQKLSRFIGSTRLSLAEKLYRTVSRQEVPEENPWDE